MLQPDANRIVKNMVGRSKGQECEYEYDCIPGMRDADVTKEGKTIWYFDRVDAGVNGRPRCFSHTVRRYYPVANLTRTRQAVIVEPLRPERFFVRTFNATSLYILSICEVCGSYQCPYCPFYSAAYYLDVNWTLLLGLVTVCIVTNFSWISSVTSFTTTTAAKARRQSAALPNSLQ